MDKWERLRKHLRRERQEYKKLADTAPNGLGYVDIHRGREWSCKDILEVMSRFDREEKVKK